MTSVAGADPMTSGGLGRVASLWRYPVKSMLGQSLPRLEVNQRGVVGDRLSALRDEQGKFGSGKTRRFRRIDGLFGFAASAAGDVPLIRFPDGKLRRGNDPGIDEALSATLGLAVTLAREAAIPHHDAAPVHIVTTASLAWLQRQLPESRIDARRFRPNLVVDVDGDGPVEQDWVGRRLAIGDTLRVEVRQPTERCAMVTMAQSELETDVMILRNLARDYADIFGIYADVVTPGAVNRGDTVAFA
jgi:hypothetical protein